jgi:hypothetical protein
MKIWVAHNKTVPLSILNRLSEDEDPRVREAVAVKRKCSREIFEKLANDPDPVVRSAVAHNKKSPADVLERLSHDAWHVVSDAARRRLNEIEG